ncbi:hypothetical protein HDV02_003913 [Globomyces sp. JEL0801]|nr:hypothetical protein HDV02_003913 [Globomyces sp. JEL0801]
MTAAAISILVNQGKLSWDKPLKTYVPGVEFSDPWVTDHVTILDILTHRTGLSSYMDGIHGKNGLLDSKKVFLKNLKSLPLVGEFRSSFEYNNMMYSLACLIIKEVSGKPYAQFVEEHIFKPLGITKFSWYTSSLKKTGDFAAPHEFAYSIDEFYNEFKDAKAEDNLELKYKQVAGWSFEDDHMIGVGTLALPATEMSKWVRCLMNDGKSSNGTQVVFDVEFLSKPHNTYTGNALGYGCGLFTKLIDGHVVKSHTGGLPGYCGEFSYVKSEKISLFIANNTNRPLFIHDLILSELLNHSDISSVTKQIDQIGNPFALISYIVKKYRTFNEGYKQIHPRFDEFVGTYTHPAYGEVVISKEDRPGHLSMVRQPEYSVLYPYSKKDSDDDQSSLSFYALDGLISTSWFFKVNDDGSIVLYLKDRSGAGEVEINFFKKA